MITSIIVHYERKNNIRAIVDSLCAQTIKNEVWIWDNSSILSAETADVVIHSSRNFIQQPRWVLPGFVKTDYIWLQDDDRIITDNQMFEKLIQESKEHPDSIFGVKGKIFQGDDIDQEKPYQHHTGWVSRSMETDMINTGFCFFPRKLINKIPVNPFDYVSEKEYRHGDDIYVSKFLNTRVSSTIVESIKELNECGHKLSGRPEHMTLRNTLCKRFWL